MHGWNDEAILVVGDGHDLVHILDLRSGQTDLSGDGVVDDAVEGLGSHVGAHGQHTLEPAHVRHGTVGAHAASLRRRLDRRQWRHVPHHRQRAVFGVEREGDLPLHRHLPDWGFAGGIKPCFGHAVCPRLLDDAGIVGIEKDRELRLVQVLVVLDAGRTLDAIGIVQNDTEIADAPDACLRAYRRLTGFDARVAENAFLRFTARPVVIDLLVGAARDAHAPAATFVLVDENDAILLALVDRARGAGCDACRVEAVLAQAWQVHHEGVFELAVDLLLHAVEVDIGRALGELTSQDLLPVGPPFDLLHALAGDQRARPGGWEGFELRCLLQVLIVEGKGFVVVVDLGQVGVGKDLGQHAPLAADFGVQLAVALSDPAAVPALLVLPVFGVADTGFCLDVVEPGVLHAFAVGPNVLAGDRTSVAPDALIEVQYHRDLCANLHGSAPANVGSLQALGSRTLISVKPPALVQQGTQ